MWKSPGWEAGTFLFVFPCIFFECRAISRIFVAECRWLAPCYVACAQLAFVDDVSLCGEIIIHLN